MSADNPKIFVSSTFEDLRSVREELHRWLSGIFGATMIIMESFGSDAEPPNVMSVRRVRECEIFIGIYAHRYGTVDPGTGESITELELDEARIAFSAGVIKSILLYVVDPKSNWLLHQKDQSVEAENGRTRLYEKLSRHTYTRFRTEPELLFSVIRDVYRLVARGFNSEQRRIKSLNLPSPRKISRPIGMEFLTSGDQQYLGGRQTEISETITQLEREPITLLLGESGVGKTSLLHAGVIPEAIQRGWRPIYTRPFGMPCKNIVEQIDNSIFVGSRRSTSLLQTIAEVLTVLDGAPLLLLIDQFEDVLSTQSETELTDLTSGLAALRELGAAGLRVLISYRSDLEGRLGALWQRISGSSRGFPRIYVSGLKPEALWVVVQTFCADLRIELQLNSDEIRRICGDIIAVSREVLQSGIYPPYVQMFLDQIWRAQQGEGASSFTFVMYEEGGRISGIINRYLAQQLQYANDTTGELRLLLIALVRSYGVKTQRTLQELAADTGIDVTRCELQLERLIDLRLVRHISGRYEVSHDFLARMILEKLVDTEEREFKRFRELLSLRAAAFMATSNNLSVEEVLFLYKSRQRVIFNRQEAVLIFDTWIKNEVPGLFWIKDFDTNLVEQQLTKYENIELGPEQRYSVLFLRTFFGLEVRAEDFSALLRIYKIASEAARMISLHRNATPDSVIWLGLRNKRAEIRNACFDIVLSQIQSGDVRFLKRIRNSHGSMYADVYFQLALNSKLPTAATIAQGPRERREFACLQSIIRAQSPRGARENYMLLRAMRPTERASRFAKALIQIRNDRVDAVISEIRRASASTSRAYISALRAAAGRENFDKILCYYVSMNRLEKDRRETRALRAKARDLAQVIRRLSSPDFVPSLRYAFQEIRLHPSSRDITAAILENGEVEDVLAVLSTIGEAQYPIYYENQTEMCQALVSRLNTLRVTIPESFRKLLATKNFWQFIPAEERRTAPPESILPVHSYENRVLFIRIVAHAIIGLVRSPDEEALRRLVNHPYITVSRPAAARLSELMGEEALQVLASEIEQAILSGRGSALAEALRAAERGLYAKRDSSSYILARDTDVTAPVAS